MVDWGGRTHKSFYLVISLPFAHADSFSWGGGCQWEVPYQEEAVDDSELTKKVEKADGILQALLQFCQRNSGRMDEKARQVGVVILIVLVCSLSWFWSHNHWCLLQAMWFPTFDKIHSLQKKYEPATNQVISESKSLLYVWSEVLFLWFKMWLVPSSVQCNDWNCAQQYAGTYQSTQYHSENHPGR